MYAIKNINHGITKYRIIVKFEDVEYLKDVSEKTKRKKVEMNTYFLILKYLILFFDELIRK